MAHASGRHHETMENPRLKMPTLLGEIQEQLRELAETSRHSGIKANNR
jgi:hypothetical protein